MKKTLFLATLVLLSPSLQAGELLRSVEDTVSVTAEPGKQRYPLIELAEPGITLPVYALKGMIRYENVEQDAWLQLDNDFGEKGTFFTKAVADSGLLEKVHGTSDWRPFALPFYASDGRPEKLSLSLHMPGSGAVAIRGVALFQYAEGEDPLQTAGQWFGNRGAGLLGGIGGGILGLWGALIGVLSSRGKARNFVMGSANVLLVLGAVCLVIGALAFATGQPYAVYYTFLLMGIIVLLVLGPLRRTLAAQYEQSELKRMQSMDA